MSAYYQQQDLRHFASTWPEATQGAVVAVGNMNREWRLSDQRVAESIKRTLWNLCGGEFYTGVTDESADADLDLNAIAIPDLAGWYQYYLFGGNSGYSVTGSGDPYTHEYRPIQAPDYRPDAATIIETFKNSSEYWRYRGGLFSNGQIVGNIDGDKRIQVRAAVEFAGEREGLAVPSPPTCTGEQAYRMGTGNASFVFKEFGQSAISGLVSRGFAVSVDNRLEGRDEADRSGLYIASRDRGDRSDSFRVTYSVLGKDGDAADLLFRVGSFVSWSVTLTNPVANRQWVISLGKGVIVAKRKGWSTSVNKSTHDFDIVGCRDDTSPTTTARSPIYTTIETATPTYAQAA